MTHSNPDQFASMWYLTLSPRHEGRDLPPGVESLHGRVRTLADMTEAEVQALEAEYGCPVQRPAGLVRRAA